MLQLQLTSGYVGPLFSGYFSHNYGQTVKQIDFKAESCQKYRLYRKKFKIKVWGISISYKKLSGRPCQSPPRVALGDSKGYDIQNIIMLKIGKYSHFEAESCQKYRLYRKKFKIKVLAFQFPTKNSVGRPCLSPPRVVRGDFSLL